MIDLTAPPPDPEEEKEIQEKEATKEMQSLLISKLPKREYEKVSKLQTESGGDKFDSYHSIAKDLPKVREIKFTYDLSSISVNTGSLNNEPVTAVDSDKEEVVSVVGAYISFGDCVKVLLKKIEEVVSKTKGVTMEQALDRAYVLTCADSAQHKFLPKETQNVITYSITLVSRVLVERCGIYPSSSRWIVPHVQLQAKENVETLQKVLQLRNSNAACHTCV